MLSALLVKFGLPALVNLVSGALAKVDNPIAKTASSALADVSTAIGKKEITPEQLAEGHRHIEALDKTESEDFQTALREVNATIRAEAQSDDVFTRRWRPFFGYVTAVTWGLQATAIAFAIVWATLNAEQSSAIFAGLAALMGAMTVMWGIALSVLGVQVVQRSRDKAVAAGAAPPTFIEMLMARKTAEPEPPNVPAAPATKPR
jgi:hypothetical protein